MTYLQRSSGISIRRGITVLTRIGSVGIGDVVSHCVYVDRYVVVFVCRGRVLCAKENRERQGDVGGDVRHEHECRAIETNLDSYQSFRNFFYARNDVDTPFGR
jgi:hypothetical protein